MLGDCWKSLGKGADVGGGSVRFAEAPVFSSAIRPTIRMFRGFRPAERPGHSDT
jgi:hypothetical protein